MNNAQDPRQAPQEPQEEMVHGLPGRLFDGYDGGSAPPPDFIQQLLQSAPPEVRARAEEYARQQAQAQGAGRE